MNSALSQMLSTYDIKTIYDRKNAMKEIMQEIILCGLSRAGFFKKAAFYGGTALRIFYGLDRFSEDLDFSLTAKDPAFDLQSYFPVLRKEILSFGLNVEIQEKEKSKDSHIRSAFLKGNTKEHLLLFFEGEQTPAGIPDTELIKIKFEIDIDPPEHAGFEHKYRLLPAPYEVNLYDMPSLFAGKVHAVLARSWRNRIKGKDLYDYVFYLSRGASLNLPHLNQRLADSGTIPAGSMLSLKDVKQLLCKRFDSIDYAQAKQDVIPFIRDTASLDVWSKEFFRQITEGLRE